MQDHRPPPAYHGIGSIAPRQAQHEGSNNENGILSGGETGGGGVRLELLGLRETGGG